MLCARERPDCASTSTPTRRRPAGRPRWPRAQPQRPRSLRHRLLPVHVLRYLHRGLSFRRAVLGPRSSSTRRPTSTNSPTSATSSASGCGLFRPRPPLIRAEEPKELAAAANRRQTRRRGSHGAEAAEFAAQTAEQAAQPEPPAGGTTTGPTTGRDARGTRPQVRPQTRPSPPSPPTRRTVRREPRSSHGRRGAGHDHHRRKPRLPLPDGRRDRLPPRRPGHLRRRDRHRHHQAAGARRPLAAMALGGLAVEYLLLTPSSSPGCRSSSTSVPSSSSFCSV